MMASNQLYDKYDEWKNWDQEKFYTIDKVEASYLEKELGRFELRDANVLEIGFGNATKLAWLVSRGAKVYGTEVNERLRERALSAGIEVLPTDFGEIRRNHNDKFDIILAYDVFEHLTIDEVRGALVAISEMLQSNGILVARFPNGRSPLGRTHQYADHTHRSVLSDSIIEHLSRDLNMSLEAKSNGDYVPFPNSIRSLLSGLKLTTRSLMNYIIQKLYDIDTPIGSNIIITLRKKKI